MISMKWAGAAAVLAIVAAAGFPAAAGPPSAPGRLAGFDDVSSESFDAVQGQMSTATVVCPDGKVVAGGGGTNSGRGEVRMQHSWPDRDRWHSSVIHYEEQTRRFSTKAVCGFVNDHTIASHTHTLTPRAANRIFEPCPAGLEVLGGGWYVEPGDYYLVYASYPQARVGSSPGGWTVQVFNESTNESINLRTYAVCGSGIANYHVEGRQPSERPRDGLIGFTVPCPANSRALSGGFDFFRGAYVISSLPGPFTDWTIEGAVVTGDPEITYNVYAVCGQ